MAQHMGPAASFVDETATSLLQAIALFRKALPNTLSAVERQCPFTPSFSEDVDEGRLMQQLTACLHEARPSLAKQLVPPLLELFALGMAAGRTLTHAPCQDSCIAARDAHHDMNGRPPVSVHSSTPSSSDSHACSISSSPAAAVAAVSTPHAATAPPPRGTATDAHAHTHAHVDWSQPIDPSAANSGCPFMAILASQRGSNAGDTPPPAAPRAASSPGKADAGGGSSSSVKGHAATANPTLTAIRTNSHARIRSSDGQGAPSASGGGTPHSRLGPIGAPASSKATGSPGGYISQAPIGSGASPHAQVSRPGRDATFAAVTGTPEGPAPQEELPHAPADAADEDGGSMDLMDDLPAMSDALYSKLGSWNALIAAVDKFYANIMSIERFKGCYAHIPARAYMVRKMAGFLAFACCGKLPYDARTLWVRHSHIIRAFQLMPEDVDVFAQCLHDALDSVGIHPDVVQLATGMCLQYRDLFHPAVSEAVFDDSTGTEEQQEG